jgi:hypothetical protein
MLVLKSQPARFKGKAVSEGDGGACSPVKTMRAGFVNTAQRMNSASRADNIDRYLRLKWLVALESVCIMLLIVRAVL